MTTTTAAPQLDPLPNLPNSPNSTDDLSSASTHRRVELQSPADLLYLKNNVSRAARAKIDLHLPLEAALREGTTGVDGLRRAVESGVGAYIEDTFAAARAGISVNGIEAEKVEWEKEGPEEFEPYDTRLATRISALHSTIETLNLSLANTRRTAAARAAAEFQASFLIQSQQLQTALQQSHAEMGVKEDVLTGLSLGWQGREEDVRRTWQWAVESLGELQSGLTETSGRAERAGKVVGYLEGK